MEAVLQSRQTCWWCSSDAFLHGRGLSFFLYNFIYLLLVVLGLCCCVGFSLVLLWLLWPLQSVMSDSVRPHRWQPTRVPRPWDSPGKNTRVGCHFLLQCRKLKNESEVAQSCPTLRDPMDCSLPGSSVHGIFQARVLEWVPLPSPLL